MSKKSARTYCLTAVICAVAILSVSGAHKAQAFIGFTTMNLFKSVNLLGVNLVTDGSARFILADMNGATSTHNITLPSTTGNSGLTYIIKRSGVNEFGAVINLTSGDTFENTYQTDWGMYNSGDYMTLVADDANDTWWVVNIGTSSI